MNGTSNEGKRCGSPPDENACSQPCISSLGYTHRRSKPTCSVKLAKIIRTSLDLRVSNSGGSSSSISSSSSSSSSSNISNISSSSSSSSSSSVVVVVVVVVVVWQ